MPPFVFSSGEWGIFAGFHCGPGLRASPALARLSFEGCCQIIQWYPYNTSRQSGIGCMYMTTELQEKGSSLSMVYFLLLNQKIVIASDYQHGSALEL